MSTLDPRLVTRSTRAPTANERLQSWLFLYAQFRAPANNFSWKWRQARAL